MGKVRSSVTNGLASSLTRPFRKLVFVLSSTNKIMLYARDATSIYQNHSSLKIQQKTMNSDSYREVIIMKNTINAKKKRSSYTMKHAMNKIKIRTDLVKTTSINFLTKSLK